jgi:hypothetical protein
VLPNAICGNKFQYSLSYGVQGTKNKRLIILYFPGDFSEFHRSAKKYFLEKAGIFPGLTSSHC